MKYVFILVTLGVCLVHSALVASADKPDKELPFTVFAISEWSLKTDKREDAGASSVRVSGKLELQDQADEHLTYQSKDARGQYGYELKTRVIDPNSKCFDKIIFEEKGSGNVRPQMNLQTFYGDSGKGQAMQYLLLLKKVSPLDLINFMNADPVDTYFFKLIAPLGIKTRTKSWSESDSCSVPRTQDRKKAFTLDVLCGEIKHQLMADGDTWTIDEGWLIGSHPSDMAFGYSECVGAKLWIPEEGNEDARFRVGWVIGKPKGMVRIDWQNHDDPRYPGRAIDITGEEQDILVGQRIRLTARLEPRDLPVREGHWEIDGEVIKRFAANDAAGEPIPLSDEDKKRPQIDFVWVQGEFGGQTLNVKYVEELNGANLEAETTFEVYKPKPDWQHATGSISLQYASDPTPTQPFDDANEYLKKTKCKLAAPTSGSHSKPNSVPKYCAVKFDYGMVITSDIQMPAPFLDSAHCLQYVQLARPEEWYTLDCMSPQKLFKDQQQGKQCLDDGYPYLYGNYFKDSPDTNLNVPFKNKPCWVDRTWRRDSFEVYLMFLPCEQEGSDCEWVPMKMGTWDWGFSMEKTGDLADYNNDPEAACPNIYSFMSKQPATGGLKTDDDPDYPRWDCVTKAYSESTSDPIPAKNKNPPGW